MIFIDSNIVIDLIEGDADGPSWSRDTLAYVRRGQVSAVNAIVIAECASHFANVDEQMSYFADMRLTFHDLPVAAARRAGLAHRAYRRAGGERIAILADFLIGAHAETLGATLMTRDRQRFATYFPDLTLITPETDHG